MIRPRALLVLSDGTTFEGFAAGYLADDGVTTGEFVFNTALSGYQEVITDPSYAGQIIAFTYPHIGNYGVSPLDDEALRPWCRGLVVRDLSDLPSNWRSVGPLEGFLRQHRVPAIVGIDTRRLTRHLRAHGALPGAFGHAEESVVRDAATHAKGTDGADLVTAVSTPTAYESGAGDVHVVAFDYGIKTTMVRQLGERFRVTVVPSSTSAKEVRDVGPGRGLPIQRTRRPRGARRATWPWLRSCSARCRSSAYVSVISCSRARWEAPPSNFPSVTTAAITPSRTCATGRIEITAQNHNYAVIPDSLERAAS